MEGLKKYLYDRARADSLDCFYCGEDDAEHTLLIYVRWALLRFNYTNSTGKLLNADNLIVGLLKSETHWQITYTVAYHRKPDKR